MASQGHFRVEINPKTKVGELILNNPSKLNVLSVAWAKELAVHLEALESHNDVVQDRIYLIF